MCYNQSIPGLILRPVHYVEYLKVETGLDLYHTRFVMASDWAALPNDILDCVVERLVSLSDYLRCSVVCKPWYYVAKGQQSRRRATMPKCPMLMISTDKEDTWMVYNAMDNKILDLQVNLPNMRFCGSSKGWLVAVDVNFVVTLINPFFSVKGREREDSIISLPPLTPPGMDERRERHLNAWSNCDHYVMKATISADPILNAEDCIVVVIYNGFSRLAFIRISKDRTWTYTDERYIQPTEEVICVEDKFYAVSTIGQLLSFDITPESYSDVKSVGTPEEVFDFRKAYLVHSGVNGLLMILRIISFEGEALVRRTTEVLVFRFDFVKHRWTKINSLGDVSLFLGDNSSESVLASSNSGCLPNCIYFTHDTDCVRGLYRGVPHGDFGVYNLEYESFIPIDTMHVATLVKNTGRGRPIWVIPTFKL